MRNAGLLLLLALALSGCRVSESETTEARTGEAYARVNEITELAILPVILPDTIGGVTTEEEVAAWRLSWPSLAANEIVEGMKHELFLDVDTRAAEAKPVSGYYFQLTISKLEIADPDVVAADPMMFDQDGWSREEAVGAIFDANDGELVAELKFHVSSGGGGETAFEQDMNKLGEQLADWLEGAQR
ncbi:MAG: hypothetical protein R3E76_08785 [Planctomycetota bacterium]